MTDEWWIFITVNEVHSLLIINKILTINIWLLFIYSSQLLTFLYSLWGWILTCPQEVINKSKTSYIYIHCQREHWIFTNSWKVMNIHEWIFFLYSWQWIGFTILGMRWIFIHTNFLWLPVWLINIQDSIHILKILKDSIHIFRTED